ncbi:hypothetical protein MYX84_02250 [Acidobacteria bacterium AH-259-O06]|nr:hypothetical protein [Acidobacteria bacterium AH-259-O06]
MTEQIDTETKGIKPIWYFVGWLLLIVGFIVTASGIYGMISPPPPEMQTVLYELHTSIWWGTVIAVAGVIFLVANRKTSE